MACSWRDLHMCHCEVGHDLLLWHLLLCAASALEVFGVDGEHDGRLLVCEEHLECELCPERAGNLHHLFCLSADGWSLEARGEVLSHRCDAHVAVKGNVPREELVSQLHRQGDCGLLCVFFSLLQLGSVTTNNESTGCVCVRCVRCVRCV